MSEEKKDSKTEEAEEEKKEEVKDEETKEESKPEEAKSETASESSNDNEEVEVPEKFKSLVEQIEQMSVLDLSELVKILEKKFGVSAAPVAIAGVAAAGGGDEGGAEEKDAYDVELAGIGDNKIAVIKVVREVTGKGLKDSKDMVEGAPIVIKEGAKKDEAEEIKKKIEEAGGQVNLK